MIASAVEQAGEILQGRAVRDAPLGALTTYRVGGTAALFLEIESPAELELAIEVVSRTGAPTLVIGKGSNMLVADIGFDGMAIRLSDNYAAVEVDAAERLVKAGGAAAYPVVARRAAAASLTGMEWAVGIPGSVGGAVRMNAGGHGADTAGSLLEAEIVSLASGEWRRDDREALQFAYRRSAVGPDDLVVSATYRTEVGERDDAEARISEIVAWRRANQPGGQNAGSVFTNPPGDSAGRLIEAAGLKGFRIGTAAVSTKHANFIQADPSGSADDVLRLVAEVRRRVEQRTGVTLVPELRLVGATL